LKQSCIKLSCGKSKSEVVVVVFISTRKPPVDVAPTTLATF